MKTKMNLARGGGASASKKLLAAIAVLAVAFAVFAAIPVAVDDSDATVAEGSVAKIGDTGYATLAAAIDAVTSENNTITLLENVTENVTIASGKNVVLNLDGFKLTNVSDHTITNHGNLTINDSSTAKTGTVDNITHARGALKNDGTVVMNGGTFERSQEKGTYNPNSNGGNSWYTVYNDGTMTINNGVTVKNNGGYSSNLENGHDKESMLTINGGTFIGGINSIKNDSYGVAVVKGGVFKNTSQATFMNWNVATISGGEFDCAYTNFVNGSYGSAEDHTAGELTITGGKFKNGTGLVEIYYHPAHASGVLGFGKIVIGPSVKGTVVAPSNSALTGEISFGDNKVVFDGVKAAGVVKLAAGSVTMEGDFVNDGAGTITVTGDAKITGDSSLGTGVKIIVGNGATLTVKAGVKLTAVDTTASVENNGTIITEAGADIAGVTISGDGEITNNADDSEMSEVTVGGISDVGKTVFSAKNIVTVNKSWTLIDGSDVVINGKLVIPEGATLTIQSGAKLTIDNNAVFEIEGTLVIEEAEEGAPAEWGLIVKMGEVRISNNVTVNGPVDVQANGKLTIGQDGTLIIGTEGSLTTIAGSKVTVDASGTLQVNGQFDGATIYNKGIVIINTDKDASNNTIVIQGADGAVVDVVKYTVKGGSSAKLTVKDDGMVFTTYRNGSSSVNVTIRTNNSVEIAPVVSVTAATGSEEDAVAANYTVAVSGLKVVSGVSTEATTVTGNDGENGVYNQKQYSKTLDVAGTVSISAAYAGEGTAASTITSTATLKFDSQKNAADKGKSSIAVSGDLELQSGVTVDNANGTLAVTGTVVAQTGAEYKNTASGAAKVTGEGEISNVKALTSVTATEYVTKAKDSTGKEVSTYHYVNIDKALAVLSAEGSAVKYAKLMADQTVTADATVPEGATLDISNCKLTVGKAGKDTALTFANGSILKGAAAGTIEVNGVLKALNKSNVKVTDDKIKSDVKTEQVDENGKPVKNGWVQWTNVTVALNGAESGSTVTVTGTEVKISANTNVKDGVTLVVPSGSTLLLQPGITLTIDGILKLDGDIKAPAFDLTAMNLTATTGNKYSSTIVVNGTLMSSAPIAYGNGTTDDSKDATSSILAVDGVAPIAGAYYSMDGYNVISSVAVAQSNAAKIENYLVTIHGKVNAGDVSFTGTENFNKIIVSADATTSASLNNEKIGTAFTFSSLALTGVEFEIASTGTAGYATGSLVFGDVSLALKDVTGLKAKVADSKVVLDGTVDISKTGASFAVSKGTAYTAATFTVTDTTKKNTFAVSADAVLEAGANNTGDIASLTVDGVLAVPTGKGMTVIYLKVNGTVNVDAATLTSVAGKLSVTNATIGDVGKTKVGAVATFNGPIATSGVVIISSAAVVDDAFTASLPTMKTEYYVDGKVWFTAYGTGSVTPGEIPVDNVKPAGWSKTEGGAAEKDADGTIKTTFATSYDKLYALYETQVYKIVVKADEGIADVYLNGQAMSYGSVAVRDGGDSPAAYYYAYFATVAAGDYKVTYTLKNGWSGDAKLAGDNVSGMSFNVSGDYSADKVYQLSGIEKSGYVDPTPAPSEDKDDGLTITDYLLIVLVVLIVILAVIVAMRLMRS